MLSATWVPRVYAGFTVLAYIGGMLCCPGVTLSPSALGAVYPSRPFYQLCNACAVLPHFTLVLLWGVLTRSPKVSLVGLAKVMFWLSAFYITQADSKVAHGFLGMLHAVFVAMWMLILSLETKEWSVNAQTRKKILLAYTVTFLFCLHTLSRYLSTGFGQTYVSVGRMMCFLLDILFDLLSVADFVHLQFRLGWIRKYEV